MKFIYSLCFFILTSVAIAQPLPYEFSVLNIPYNPISEGESLPGTLAWDDEYWTANLGFEFTYMDSTYTTLSFLGPFGGLGTEIIMGEYEDDNTYDVICPALLDIISTPAPEVCDVRYTVQGPPGNAVFILQWENVALLGENGTTDSRINLQLWLYEATNSIEFRYGPTVSFDVMDYFMLNGLPIYLGNDINIFGDPLEYCNIWKFDGEADDPNVNSYQSLNEFYTGEFLAAYPSDGVVYHFEGTPDSTDFVQEFNTETLSLYPTVAHDFLKIQSLNGNQTIDIIDMAGRVVLTSQLNGQGVLEVSALASGSYIARSMTPAGIQTGRFIKD